jgi:hypothetical protein
MHIILRYLCTFVPGIEVPVYQHNIEVPMYVPRIKVPMHLTGIKEPMYADGIKVAINLRNILPSTALHP